MSIRVYEYQGVNFNNNKKRIGLYLKNLNVFCCVWFGAEMWEFLGISSVCCRFGFII